MEEVNGKRLTFGHGIGLFFLGGLILIFLCVPIQMNLETAGLIITEAIMLFFAVGMAVFLKQDMQKVFPIKIPKPREIGGTILIWMAFLGICIFAMSFSMYLFPNEMENTVEGTNNSIEPIMKNPFFIVLFIMAIMPAVCEEALFRGLIQHCFKRVRPWIQIFLVGIMFGVFHMAPLRILPTAALGIGLSYLRMKTGNMALPMFFHFIHNGVLCFFSFITAHLLKYTEGVTSSAAMAQVGKASESVGNYLYTYSENMQMLGASMFFLWAVPAALLFGSIFLEPVRPFVKGRFRDKRPQICAAIIATVLLIAATFTLFALADM